MRCAAFVFVTANEWAKLLKQILWQHSSIKNLLVRLKGVNVYYLPYSTFIERSWQQIIGQYHYFQLKLFIICSAWHKIYVENKFSSMKISLDRFSQWILTSIADSLTLFEFCFLSGIADKWLYRMHGKKRRKWFRINLFQRLSLDSF